MIHGLVDSHHLLQGPVVYTQSNRRPYLYLSSSRMMCSKLSTTRIYTMYIHYSNITYVCYMYNLYFEYTRTVL